MNEEDNRTGAVTNCSLDDHTETTSRSRIAKSASEKNASETPIDSKLWYKEAVFYELYIRAFCDTTGSGCGDFMGAVSKLDYLHNLGVDCIWLLPIYPSPRFDDGYDVADYCNIHPDYGTLDDFKSFVQAVHDRSMRIIVDYVPNHTSSHHKWFQESRKSKDNPYRDYYVWSDDNTKYKDACIIFNDTEPSNWTWDEQSQQYYWHRFYASQPDLNFENPVVQEEMINVLKFWLDIGVDGFRCDAVPYLFEEEGTVCENLPPTHAYLKRQRAWMEKNYPGRVILSEACMLPKDVIEYFGNDDEFHMAFHFPVMPRIFMALAFGKGKYLKEILEETPPIPKNCQWVTFLRNHDELTLEMVTDDERDQVWNMYAPEKRMRINRGIRRRLAPLLNNDRKKLDLAHSLLFTLPGSPILYYGDEIGMGDNIWLEDRNGVRTPIQWTPDEKNGGFSSGDNLYAPVIESELYGYKRVNAQAAMNDSSSIYHAIKQMIRIRKKHPSFGTGSLTWIDNEKKEIAAYIRDAEWDVVLVVNNVSTERVEAVVEWDENHGDKQVMVLVDVLTDEKHRCQLKNGKKSITVSLEPNAFLWLDLMRKQNFPDQN